MPKSRTRTTKKQSRRVGGRPRGARLLSEQDHELRAASIAAEARGDAAAAEAAYAQISAFRGNVHHEELTQLSELDAHLPSWVFGRWVLDQALRNGDQETHVRAVGSAVEAGHSRGVDLLRPHGHAVETFVALLLSSDWVYRQVSLFDGGGLRRCLDGHVEESLVARAGAVREWVDVAMGGYQFLGLAPGVAEFLDLSTGDRRRVLDIGPAAELIEGDTVLGRLVPTCEAPGWLFESRPVRVDEATARIVAEDPGDWLKHLREAHLHGLLEPRYSWRPEGHPLLSDIPEVAWRLSAHDTDEEALRSLRRGSKPRGDDAARLLRALLVAGRLLPGDGGVVTAQYAATALLAPGVLDRVRGELTLPQWERPWRELAELCVAPARELCLELAEACGEFGREAS